MKQMIKIIRKVDVSAQAKRALELDQDYMLATLFQAMQENDEEAKIKCKVRLKIIQQELDGLERWV